MVLRKEQLQWVSPAGTWTAPWCEWHSKTLHKEAPQGSQRTPLLGSCMWLGSRASVSSSNAMAGACMTAGGGARPGSGRRRASASRAHQSGCGPRRPGSARRHGSSRQWTRACTPSGWCCPARREGLSQGFSQHKPAQVRAKKRHAQQCSGRLLMYLGRADATCMLRVLRTNRSLHAQHASKHSS